MDERSADSPPLLTLAPGLGFRMGEGRKVVCPGPSWCVTTDAWCGWCSTGGARDASNSWSRYAAAGGASPGSAWWAAWLDAGWLWYMGEWRKPPGMEPRVGAGCSGGAVAPPRPWWWGCCWLSDDA